jgi:hypothetical protein
MHVPLATKQIRGLSLRPISFDSYGLAVDATATTSKRLTKTNLAIRKNIVGIVLLMST